MENLQGTVLKGYLLEDRIGSGGFGAVYRARQTTLGREVAVKIILPGFANNPEFIRRFETEANLIARLEHPYITPLHDFWRDPDGAYLIMRYLRGGSVSQALQDGPFDLLVISELLDQIASALDFAHRQNVIHRDIKPGNILLDEDGFAYLADFGIAKDLAQVGDQVTAVDAVVGSLDYISPEQARSQPASAQTDIYSLGVTLYEMITGEHPFKNASPIERLYNHINSPLPEIEAFANGNQAAINAIIQKATAKDPDHRYPDVLSMALEFRAAVGRESFLKEENIVEQLTMREQEILAMIAAGLSNREIADELVVTVGTVKWHITQLYKKLGVRSRVQAIVRARELNLIISGDSYEFLPGLDGSVSMISLPEPENPYLGLHAFQVTDARHFFGRDELTAKLLNRLTEDDPLHRFLAVIGPSGSGKSSLVRAGLISSLWKGAIPGSEKWFVVDMIPGAHPLDKLETALIRVAANQAGNLREQLQRDERGLLRVADIILPADKTELVIVVDQFEEVFTLVEAEEERQQFLDLLRSAVSDVRSRVRVVITLRADYYDRPLHYPEFGELVRRRMETVMPLSAKGLERAIRGPAEQAGVTFDRGLVEQIVSSMNYQAGALPLLQYALTELFDRREGRLLTNEAYQEIGGAVGALANRADEIYRTLSGEAQELTHQLFLRLVTLGEGAEDARRRAPFAELLSLTENTDLMEEVIDQFAAYRFLALDHDPQTRQPIVEVAHEAILREWSRLREWLNESRDDIRRQRLLAAAAAQWLAAGQDASYLLRGSRLAEYAAWAEIIQEKTNTISLSGPEHQFLEASLIAREQRQADEEARLQRELLTAQKLAETEHARAEEQAQAAGTLRRRAAFLVGALVVAALLALTAVFFARQSNQNALVAQDNANLAVTRQAEAQAEAQQRATAQALAEIERERADDQRDVALAAESLAQEETKIRATAEAVAVLERETAENQAALATSRELAAASLAGLQDDPELSILLAMQALAVTQTSEAEEALHQAVQNSRVRQVLYAADDQPTIWLAMSPDGQSIYTSGLGGGVMWDRASDEVVFTTPVEMFQEVLPEDATEFWINRADFSPDGRFLALPIEAWVGDVEAPGLIAILDAETGEQIVVFQAHDSGIQDITFSQDGTILASASFLGSVKTWDVAQSVVTGAGQELGSFCCHEDWVYSVNFSPDGSRIITTAADNSVRAWDVSSGSEIFNVSYFPNDAVFSPDGQYVIVGEDTRMVVLEAESGAFHSFFPGPGQNFVVLSFSPDGRRLAASNYDGNIRIWNYADGELDPNPLILSGHKALVGGIAFTDEGRALFSGSLDGTVREWDVSSLGGGEFGIYGHEDRPIDAAFSPDGRLVASASLDGTAKIWDTVSREERFTLSGHEDWVVGVEFHPDGRTLATSSNDGTVRIWDVETGAEKMVIQAHDLGSGFYSGAKGLAYAPDGRHLATGGADAMARIWDVDSGEMLLELAGHSGKIFSVTYNADGSRLITSGDDGTIKVWDTADGRELWSLAADESIIWGAAFSPDGSRLASGHDSGQVMVWSFDDPDAEPQLLWQTEHHPQWVGTPGFSPDGDYLVVPGADQTSIYNADTGEHLIDLGYAASAAVFSPDGRIVATAGNDGLVRLLAADVKDLLALARTRVTRALSEEECQRYLHVAQCPAE